MKMMNCAVEQPGLDGDLGRPSHRTRKGRYLSDSDENEHIDVKSYFETYGDQE